MLNAQYSLGVFLAYATACFVLVRTSAKFKTISLHAKSYFHKVHAKCALRNLITWISEGLTQADTCLWGWVAAEPIGFPKNLDSGFLALWIYVCGLAVHTHNAQSNIRECQGFDPSRLLFERGDFPQNNQKCPNLDPGFSTLWVLTTRVGRIAIESA